MDLFTIPHREPCGHNVQNIGICDRPVPGARNLFLSHKTGEIYEMKRMPAGKLPEN